jgi:hypothetical protein
MLSLLAGEGWLAPGALVIVERATRSGPARWPDGFVPDRARKYGEATFWYGLVPETAATRENLGNPAGPGTTSAVTGPNPLRLSRRSREDGTACNA